MSAMIYRCDINKEEILDAINRHECYDSWGEVQYGNDKTAVEYNVCIDNTTEEMENCSAFYRIYADEEGYWENDDCNTWSRYHIDFTDKDWELKLEEAAKKAYKELFDEEEEYEN